MGMTCAFVQVDGRLDGIGKLTDLDANWAIVEYFTSPAGPSLERVRVPAKAVHPIELSAQTRIFWFDRAHHAWVAGRVDGGLVSARAIQATEDHYHVRFPNGQQARVPISQLYTRWAHPIEDPTDYLAARITDTPFWFDARSRIVRHISAQRAAFGGLTGLASAAVELLEHQVTIVRRVLADPVERYLLADEVGLGKTIEAGILIRQHIIDQPYDAHVLVIVPGHLVAQWKSELESKLFLTGSSVEIVSDSALVGGKLGSTTWTMLVVDEAHRTAQWAFHDHAGERCAYEELRSLARNTPRVLLLSGTPVLHQEDGFLAMLHLLDPDAYPLNDRQAFHRRVAERQSVAEATADLMDDASSFFAEDAIARIENVFASDPRLMELCAEARIRLADDIAEPARMAALRALRSHLTEVYRLHRRLLRTRRGDPRVQAFLPVRTGLIKIEHEDQSRVEAFDFLDAWRLALSPDETAVSANRELFSAFVEAALSHPLVLVRKMDARLANDSADQTGSNSEYNNGGSRRDGPGRPGRSVVLTKSAEGYAFSELAAKRITGPVSDQNLAASLGRLREHGWTPVLQDGVAPGAQSGSRRWAFGRENELLEQRRQLISESLAQDPRTAALSQWLRSHTEVRKAIVFVDDAEVADLVRNRLGETLPSYWIERFRGHTEDVQAFEASTTAAVLVCDAGAEEGLNLQRHGAVIVHYDLPLAPARIEQRIGRVDRIEARGRLRNVCFSSGQPYEREWLACLDQAIRIFHRSVAPLQYVLAEATERIRTHLVQEGWTAIEDESTRLRDSKTGLESELRRIYAQEAIDAIDINPDADTQFYQAVLDQDESAAVEGERILNSWVTDRLQFGRQHLGRSVLRYFHDLHRPTLLPMYETINRFQGSVDREALAGWRHGAPLEAMTFDRVTAETKGVSLLRVGHPFMQALESLVRSDDRGMAFAMWRYLPGWRVAAQPILRFDFVIEADVYAGKADRVPVSTSVLRRRADAAFPVRYRTVWLTSDLEEVTEPDLLALLSQPYSKWPRPDGGRDFNLRSVRWDRAAQLVSFGDWSELCFKARKAAESLIRNRAEFRTQCDRYASRVRDSAATIANAFVSRKARLSGAIREAEERMAEMEARLAEALIAGIEHPTMRVDSAGVAVISGEPLEAE
jgi:ATP-dependent helicase HepA